MNDAKIAKICNLLEMLFIGWIIGQNVQRSQISAITASFLWGNLKEVSIK